MKADENTYSKNVNSNEYFNNGDKIKFVNAYQGRNNRRITISGSINLCSNKFYYLSNVDNSLPLNSPNANFCQDLLNWNFQRTGVLKFENIRHQRVNLLFFYLFFYFRKLMELLYKLIE